MSIDFTHLVMLCFLDMNKHNTSDIPIMQITLVLLV